MKLFEELEKINKRPEPFEYYTTPQLWNDPHISKGMLKAHLDPTHDAASFREELINRSVNWIASRFNISEETSICDFGCGPGLWTTRFAERGAIVTGIDLSERSINYAREIAKKKTLAIRYILQNYLLFSTNEQFNLITMISGDFSVLSPEQCRVLLRTFRTALADDGVLLLDVASHNYFIERDERSKYEFINKAGYWSPEPHHVFSNRFKYESQHLLCDKYTVVEKERQFEIYNWTQCYNVETINTLFKENGLKIVEYFSEFTGTPLKDDSRVIAVVAMRSSDQPG